MILGQHEAAQFRPKMPADAGRQPCRHHVAIRPPPALAALSTGSNRALLRRNQLRIEPSLRTIVGRRYFFLLADGGMPMRPSLTSALSELPKKSEFPKSPSATGPSNGRPLHATVGNLITRARLWLAPGGWP